MANNGYVDPELFLHDEIKAFRATKSQNWQIGVYRCQFFQNQSETVVLGNYHFLWSTPNKSVQQPEQPTIYEWLKIRNIYIYTYDYTHIFMYIYIYMCVRVFYWTKGDASQLAEREREMPLLQSESVTPRATFGAFIILISSGMRIFTQKWTPFFSHFLHTRFPVSRFPKSWGKLQIIQVIRP